MLNIFIVCFSKLLKPESQDLLILDTSLKAQGWLHFVFFMRIKFFVQDRAEKRQQWTERRRLKRAGTMEAMPSGSTGATPS